ncbi:MAG TPA: hypothetical protein VFV68_07475 [Agriterribacter sp.]|nr:hypothetical protein [Agriterribacter sp.]
MKKTLQVANGIALFQTIFVNYFSITGKFGGNTVKTVSDGYKNLFTPAGYAFSIWGFIYMLLFAFVIYQGIGLFKKRDDDDFVLKIGWWFVASCMVNSMWVVVWVYEFIGLSVLIILILLFSLLKIVVNTNMANGKASPQTKVFVWLPFSIYSGWVTVASIAAVAAWLTKIEWNGFGIPEVTWTIVMICIAGAVNLFMTWNRNMPLFSLVGVWALLAIAVANRYENPVIVQAACLASVILLISAGIHFFRNKNVKGGSR